MSASAEGPIRVVVRSRMLVRLGVVLIGLAVVLATIFQLDPADDSWGADSIAPLKYAPTVLALASGGSLLAGVRGVPLSDPYFRSILALGAFVLGGSAYTMLTQGAPAGDTFFGRGLGVFTVVPAYVIAHLPRELSRLERPLRPLLVMAGLGMSILIALHRSGMGLSDHGQVYHEEAVFLVLLAGGAMAGRTFLARALPVMFFAVAASLTIKWTGFGFAAISMAALAFLEGSIRMGGDVPGLVRRRLLIFQTVVGGGAITAIAVVLLRALLPTGSADVRMQTYAQRWDHFRESPLFGSMFTGSPIVEAGWLKIPSHSDTMDIFALGGLLAATLFFVPVLRVLRECVPIFPNLARSGSMALPAATVFLPAFLFEMTFNPVLHQPKLVLFFWLGLGLLLAQRRRRAHALWQESRRRALLGRRRPMAIG